jgi:hypothetical protein
LSKFKSLCCAALLVGLCGVPTVPATANPAFVEFMKEAGKAIVGAAAREGVKRLWGRPDEEIKELRRELEQLRRLVARSAITPNGRCPETSAEAFVTCILNNVDQAQKSGTLREADAVRLVRSLGTALGVTVRTPSEFGDAEVYPTLPGQQNQNGARRVRMVGADYYCMELRRADGVLVVGFFDARVKQGEWVEISQDRRAAQVVEWRNGLPFSTRPAAVKGLGPDRKRGFEDRTWFTSPVPDKSQAYLKAATLYFDGARRETVYYGGFKDGMRHGKGCYFGEIAIHPYCYEADMHRVVPADRSGTANLLKCSNR